jgi:hypothetical protein
MSGLFQVLGTNDQARYRDSARRIFNPNLDATINELWHPVYREECWLIYLEYINQVILPSLSIAVSETTCDTKENLEQ